VNIPAVHKELHQVSANEQKLYDHLLECVRTESPEQVLERFSSLFIKARGYSNQEVLNALASVVNSKDAESRFQFVLNRCCHILINRWQLQAQTQVHIPELIGLFDYLPPGFNVRYGGNYYTRLQHLVKVFLQGDYYKQLQRLAEIVGRDKRTNPGKKQELVGNLINRYPYLYDHCLLSADSSVEQQQTVYKVKAQLEKKFEVNLSKYVTYQIRVAQGSRNEELAKKLNIIQPVSNPTLLTDKDLGRSLKQYVGTVENGYTYQELSKSFITHTSDLRNYQSFKDELYEYIIMSIDSRYGKNHFNQRLYHKLQQIYPQYNHTKPDDFLKMRTYSQLFNYLVVESPNNPQHLVFMDLVSNMGTTKTIGMFLKLVLVCSKVKPYLEKRFSILFNHYESFTKDGAVWLVRSLEKLNVAFCTNFGNLDLSFLRRIYAKN
jgi:hypothetical protein